MYNLPKSITVCRVPFAIKHPSGDYSYEVLTDKQIIGIIDWAAPARKRQYLMWEVAYLLMEAAGMDEAKMNRYHKQVGNVLNRFVIDNNLNWIQEDKPFPTMLWINGIPYSLEYGSFDELDTYNLGGQITYDDLKIRIADSMEKDIKKYVVIHECTHAMLFEAAVGDLHSKEALVEALAWQILYFLQDNDLSKIKPEGD